MKKAIRFFSLALAILMLVPMISVFPVKVSATEQTYDDVHDGELLRTVNFNADEWKQGFYGNYNNANVNVSNDGTSVRLTVQNGTYKCAWWGGYYSNAAAGTPQYNAYQNALAAALPMSAGAKYTMIFDLTLDNDNVGFGIQVDGENTLMICGNGQSRWYGGNSCQVGNGTDSERWSAHMADRTTQRDPQTFAVVLDYDAKTLALYVKDIRDGAFYFCRSISGVALANVWDASVLRCRFHVRSLSGTPDETYAAEVSNLNIYKGNEMNPLFGDGCRFPFWSHADDDKLLNVNFNADEWKQGFYGNYNNANVNVANDGTSVEMTVQNGIYKCAWWGGYYPDAEEGTPQYNEYQDALGDALPLETGVKYTLIFDLTLGSDNVGFGIQVDGENAFLIRGDGYSDWYGGNAYQVGNGTEGEKWSAHIADGTTRRSKQTFALVLDYDAKTLTLYVKDINDGAFYFCRSISGANIANVWDASVLRCRFHVRSLGGTPNASYTANLSDLSIFKGNILNTMTGDAYLLSYHSHADGDELLQVNFNANEWKQGFYGNYNNAGVNVANDGTSVQMTVQNGTYKCAWWGGYYPDAAAGTTQYNAYQNALAATLPMSAGAKYTLFFDLTLGSDNVGFGIQVDGENSLMICGNGQSRWYGGNACQVGNGTNSEKWSAHMADGTTRRDKQTFAVVLDYDAKTLTLYVKDINDGAFYFCRSISGANIANVWDASVLRCRFHVRSLGGTPNASYTAELSDLTICKGADISVSHLSVMSYNIEGYGHGGDKWDGRHPNKAMETVWEYCSPDIVGFQEADDHWDPFFAPLTSHGYTRLQGETTSDGGELLEIFYKTDKFWLLSEGTYKYKAIASALSVPNPENADQSRDKHGRIFHYAVLQEKTTGKKILFINTHLHYGGTGSGYEEDEKVRRYEIRTLLAWIEAQTFDYDCTIIVGDMNAHYLGGDGKLSIQVFKDEGFAVTRDSAKVAEGDVRGTLNYSERTSRTNAEGNTYIFDYVLTKGNVETTYFTVVDNKIDNYGLSYPSDHLPILSNLTVY